MPLSQQDVDEDGGGQWESLAAAVELAECAGRLTSRRGGTAFRHMAYSEHSVMAFARNRSAPPRDR